MKVFKFTLPVTTIEYILEIPQPAIIQSVGAQENNVVVWVLVDPKNKKFTKRELIVAGTGVPLPDWVNPKHTSKYAFHGTAQLRCGEVYHVFEKK